MDARLDKDKVRKVYRKFASTYDLWGCLVESKARQRCLELADIRNGESVLEVAVGTGILFQKILQVNPEGRNEGIDLTPEMLSRARERVQNSGVPGYALNIGDAYHLQYADNTFDVILNNYMFDLIPEQDFVIILSEFKRVLRKGGRLVLANMTKGPRWFNNTWDWLYQIRPALLGGCRSIELKPFLEKAGFLKIRREYISQLFFPSEIIYGMRP